MGKNKALPEKAQRPDEETTINFVPDKENPKNDTKKIILEVLPIAASFIIYDHFFRR
jgi:hypothetical protein